MRVGGGVRHPNGAGEITGSFDCKKLSGQTVRLLQTPHPYQQSFQPLLKDWAVALQDIYGGDDAAKRLKDYAASAAAKVNV